MQTNLFREKKLQFCTGNSCGCSKLGMHSKLKTFPQIGRRQASPLHKITFSHIAIIQFAHSELLKLHILQPEQIVGGFFVFADNFYAENVVACGNVEFAEINFSGADDAVVE